MASPSAPVALRQQRTAVSGFEKDGAPYFIKCLLSPGGGVLAAALSDGRVRFFDAATLAALGVIPRPEDNSFVRDVCFASEGCVWVCYSTGIVLEWTCSESRARRSFVASPPSRVARPLRVDADDADERGAFSLAVNAGGDILAVGYEEHIIFYDLRGGGAGGAPVSPGVPPPCLGCFSNSHSGPVIQLAWHPAVPRHLLSASDDGLVCVFDTGIRGETDALVAVLNAEGGVARFGVFGPQAAFVFALTRTDTLSLWSLSSADRVAEFGDLKARLRGAGVDAEYLIDCFCTSEGRLQVLAGAHDGRLWALDVTPAGASLIGALGPAAHAATVRSAVWAQVNAAPSASAPAAPHLPGVVCWTAGEDGQLVQWADPAAAVALPPAARAADGGGGGPVRKATSAALRSLSTPHPLFDAHTRAGGRARPGPVDSRLDAATFGVFSARPVSPPRDGSAALSSDMRALLE